MLPKVEINIYKSFLGGSTVENRQSFAANLVVDEEQCAGDRL
jgi:hypothetical protein